MPHSIATYPMNSRWRALVTLLLVWCPMAFGWGAEDRLTLGSQTDNDGGTLLADRSGDAILVLRMEISDETAGINLTIQLPEGVSMSRVLTNGNIVPPADFTVHATNLPENRVSLLIYSSTSYFQQQDGVLANFYLDVAADAPLGNYPITVETVRERDVKSYEVRTPRGISNPSGEARPSRVTNCSMTISPAGTIIFSNTTLENDIAAIITNLGLNVGPHVNPIELVNVGFTSYNGSNMGIDNISGLEYATDLQALALEFNDIEDIGPLATLTNLTVLKLSGNRIKDLTPISNLTNLQELHLQFNEIVDISPLASLTNLEKLTLSGNYITDISALSGMPNLEFLLLDDNQISDVSPLQGLTNLETVLLDWNQLGDITPLTLNPGVASGDFVSVESNPLDESIFCSDLTTLSGKGVTVAHNIVACDANIDVIPDPNLENAVRISLTSLGAPPGPDISASEMAGLTILDGSGLQIASLEGLQYATNLTTVFLDNNEITDLGPLSGLQNLDRIDLSNNSISNVTPLLGSAAVLRVVNLRNNLVSDLGAFGQMPSLEALLLVDNLVFDISPLDGLSNLDTLLLANNQIVDISVLDGLGALSTVSLRNNFIQDLEPLVGAPSLSNNPTIDVKQNPLNAQAQCEDVTALTNGGANLLFDAVPCSDFIDLFEPDGKPATAREIMPGQMRHEMSLIEILPGTPDVDWVKFELDTPAQVTVESSPGAQESRDLQLQATVYDSSITPIGISTGPIVLELDPATYYVKTNELSGRIVGNYAIRVAIDEAEYEGNGVPAQQAGNDTPQSGPTIAVGTPSSGHTLTKGATGLETVAWFPLDSDPGWSTTGEWDFGVPNGTGTTSAPTSGATGSNVYGVNLTGNYSVTVDAEPLYLQTTVIDCSRSRNTYLQFQRWLNTDYVPYVDSRIEISRDGNTWHEVWAHETSNFIADSNWNTQTYDISQWADGQPEVYIRWGYQVLSASAFDRSGWYIDDVRILGNVSAVTEDVDWFRFGLGSDTFIKIRADVSFGRAKVELFGPDNVAIRISQRYVSDNDTMFFEELPAGFYWARVSEYPRNRSYDYRVSVPEYTFIVEEQGFPDTFENDDDSSNATPIDLDPVVSGGVRVVKQTHNFHDAGDEDWCVLVIPRKEIHPRLELTDLGPRANPQIDVFADDATTLLRSGSGNILIDFNTYDNQKFYIRIRNNDPNAFGPDTAYGISGTGGIEIGGFVVGYVRDQFGNPVPDVQLTIPAQNNPDIISTPSGQDGFYTFPNVPLGEHTAFYDSPCGLELSVTFTIVDTSEHNVPVEMLGCVDPNEIFVNVDLPNSPSENGTLPNPFSSVGEGVSAVAPGGLVRVKGESTAELFVAGTKITKPMTLIGENIDGITPVTIGE